ncbi:MAG: hypothetical protein KBB71_04080 [Lentimicrobiaceae bacterium]|nr:hypothetical protein [Lentimicrobiaceae bacterium]
MRIFIVTLALLSCLFAYADQDPDPRLDYVPNVIPPSPTAAELGRYGQIPVGMFTGAPQVSIPLYTLTSRYLSVPVSLSYSSNGIKVEQVAFTYSLKNDANNSNKGRYIFLFFKFSY